MPSILHGGTDKPPDEDRMTELVRRGDAYGITPYAQQQRDRAGTLAMAFLAGYSGRTREAYQRDLSQWGRWCADIDVEVLEATRAHAQLYAAQLDEAGRAPATIARKLSALAGFYEYAVVEGELDRSPLAHVRRPRVPEESPRLGLDRRELALLLQAAEAHSLVAHALICLLALNGLRISEVCGATVDDLEDERGHRLLAVRRKGGKRARVPLAPRTAAAVAALMSEHQDDDTEPTPDVAPGPVTPQTGPGARSLLGIDRFSAWRLVRRLAHAAGITKTISPHSLRHTFVTLALDAGVELRDVQDAAGHADPRTTRRYDRGRHSLDRHATYRVASFIAGDTD